MVSCCAVSPPQTNQCLLRKILQTLIRRFEEFPHLGSLVRVLKLSADCLGSPYLRGQYAKRLAAALTGLTRLQIVSFAPCRSRSKELPDLVFSFPKLAGLMIYGLKYIPEQAAAIIETTESLCTQFPSDGNPVRLTDVLCLTKAEICHDLLTWFTSPAFDLSKLQLFAMKWSAWPPGMPCPSFSALDNFCARVGSTLSVLHLGFPENIGFGRSDILSSHLVRTMKWLILGHFIVLTEIRLDLFQLEDNFDSVSPVIMSLLKTLSNSAPCLRVIEVKARYGGMYHPPRMEVARQSFC
ncbi:hypothetical protein E1B28_003892 [Marasmius oreades]|nr:uncharacterized protein E1B28_003892 [Marasmius oreades]KAG7096458.1 hypothetical protein E1B28_003892 [Marasmius oreades]